MTNSVERRFVDSVVEPADAVEGRGPAIAGYAAKFSTPSRNLGGFVESVEPTFFNWSRSEGWPDVRARYEHRDDYLLGTSDAGTLHLSLDGIGLRYLVDINEKDPLAMSVHARVERGDIRYSSFAFKAEDEAWQTTDTGYPMRSLRSGRLVDVSPTIAPAYPETDVALASLAGAEGRTLEEVRALAERGELGTLLTPPGEPAKPKGPRSAQAARVELLTKLES